MEQAYFSHINIIGLGLIGGSIAKACKKYDASQKIRACDIDQSQIDFALRNKIIDEVYDPIKAGDNELTIICAPLFAYESIFQKFTSIAENSIIIDIGSLKEFTIPLAQKILKSQAVNFIPCHPIAGSDKSGVSNSHEDLFLDKKTIITLQENTDKNKLKKVELFWKKIGSEVEFMRPEEHDKIFALVSHLPQFLSFIAKEDYVGDDEVVSRHLRLQNSNYKIWREIFTLNRVNIEYYLKIFVKNMDELIVDLKHQKSTISKPNREIILRRLSLVLCFITLPDINEDKKHAGSGFRDFTAILEYKDNPKILENNTDSAISFLKEIKNKIQHYEFS